MRSVIPRLTRLASLLITILVAGCASVEPRHDYAVEKNSGKGLVVMSLSMTMDAINVDYAVQGGGKQGTFTVDGAQKQLDWKNPKGRLIVAELPAGKYELFQWWSARGQSIHWSHRFSIAFVVAPGKATYVGNVAFVDVNMKSPTYSDEETKGTFRFVVQDMATRDIPLLLRRYGNIKESDVEKKIATVGRAH